MMYWMGGGIEIQIQKSKGNAILNGVFKQYIEGDDIRNWYLVKVEVDHIRENPMETEEYKWII